MRVIGLTGGIACGKSTVAAMLAELGAPIVDADRLAREVVAPDSEGLHEIRAEFGDEMIRPDGSLDRARMADRVFGDPAARKKLEAITHPRIARASAERMAELAGQGHLAAIYEAALLVENGLHERLAGLIVVSVPEIVQIERLRARDGLDTEAAVARIRAQLPMADKIAVATWVVDNAGPLDQTRAQVEAIWQQIAQSSSS